MKKYIKIAFIYLFVALAMGVFYREFTKALDFSGKTSLSIIHVHLVVLGFFMFMLLALFNDKIPYEDTKTFKWFMIFYNIALPFMAVMFMVRGIIDCLEPALSSGMDAMISGIAGLSHIMMLTSLILLAISFLKNKSKA